MQEYVDEHSIQEADLQRSINFGRFVAICNIALVIPWIIYFLILGNQSSLIHTLIAVAPTVVLLGVMFTKFHYGGRLLWLFMLIFLTLDRSYSRGLYVDSELTALVLLALPLLLFSTLKERKTQIVMSVAVVLTAIATLSFDLLGWHPNEAKPLVLIPEQSEFGIRMTLIALLMAQMIYFVYLNRRLTEGLLTALRQAQQAANAKGQFLANMSHEIRTPMNGMIGMLEVLESEGLKEKQRPLVGTIRNSALSLMRIIDDILDASKIEAGKMDVASSRMELIPVVEGVSQTLRVMADENKVWIRHFVDPDLPPWIVGDSGRLRQVLLNLLSNAVKYSSAELTGRDGSIWFLIEMDDAGNLRFTVRDNGIGMSVETQMAIFDPFVQGEGPAKMQIGGTGLGLVITQNLVNLMGGSITVKSTKGEGSEFVVTLPLTKAEGPSSLPDIAGSKVISLLDVNAAGERYLRGFFKSCDVDATLTHTLAKAMETGRQHQRPLFLLTSVDAAQSLKELKTLRAEFPNACFVVFSTSRSARYGRVSTDTYRIQVRPIMISEFAQAIDTMARPDATSAEAFEQETQTEHFKLGLQELHKRILAVEDNEINRAVLSKQLELLGVSFDIVANGQEGFDHWKDDEYDLILTDCYMPVMDGFEMTAAIRAEEARSDRPRIPIIAITADVMEVKHEACRAAGMDDTLTKPVELNALRGKLARLLHG